MNKVVLTGRLTRDPEIRYTQTGKAVASFSLAVNRLGPQGERVADFIPIVAWERLAETCGNNLTKGKLILVEGRLQIRSYEGNDGQKRRVAEVVMQNFEFLESKSASAGYDESRNTDDVNVNSFGKDVFPDEDIPF